MKTSTLRRVDRVVGVPACALLTLHRRLAGMRAPARPVERILFVKLAEQGSTVLAEAALCEAATRVGRDNVFFLVFEENRFILDVMGLVPEANILTLDASSGPAVSRSMLSVIRRLRSLRIDAAIDLEFFARSSAIFTYLSGAACRIGLHAYEGAGPWRGDLFTHRLNYNPYVHTADLFRLFVDALDQPPGKFPAFPVLAPPAAGGPTVRPPAAADLDAVTRQLREWTGLADVPPIILLNANCGDLVPLRRWDENRYIELAHRLLDARPEIHIVFTGRPDEAPGAERLARAVSSPRCVSLAGRTTLGQLLALYALSQVLVTNDSGPAHFATLTPIDVVTLFGPETPSLFAARTPRNHVLSAGLACSPCVNAFNNRLSACRDNLCMQRISVDEVFATTLAVLTARTASGTTPTTACSSQNPDPPSCH
jgi:ADP-heptose:LPS heptosyltransferase